MRDTLFPALDGSSPGDIGDNVDQLPDGPLPTVESWDLPDSRANISSTSAPDQSAETEIVPAEETQPNLVLEGQDAPISPSQPQPQRRKRSAEDRINQLTARYRQEQDENVQLRNQVAYLTQIMETRLNPQPAPGLRASMSADAATSADLLANPQGTIPPGAHDARGIEEAIQRAVAPLVQRVDSQDASMRRTSLHNESFARAAEEFPELLQRNSEARQYFDRLYSSHPLATLDDGPEQIAFMVRGVLESAKRDSVGQPQRKMAAAVHIPSPSATDLPTTSAAQQKNETAYEQGVRALRRGDRSLAAYRAVRMAGRARRQRI